ncbi:amino acid ABC transporter ATP-binding protein [Alkaliphilus serpentinus]|uniref:Amino acid ABC transporter ATP-binding protein n=1 Tax=Alkaliphilus serpentinus TaxID=1482731 RepID=A0A833M8U0_9FIRM|nr:amino acid ABC transporter ATP-binding protein [Alkaliphilus serpentinus]KAB3527297.1 amino acid ABC transporter ATP-binding protein [Alkaliphilus serpentinus]
MDPLIEIKNLQKSYGKNHVLKGITTSIKKGEIVSVIGPSGSGKSTLIRCMNALERLDEGEIIINGENINNGNKISRKIAMVFQHFNLFPHYKVIDNLINPCKIVRGMSDKEAKKLAVDLLEKVKLLDKANEYPSSLSGGQKQRVAIARALSMNPEIILFDEPTSSLDPELAYEVFDTMKSIARSDLTILLVTHQINMVKNFSSRVIFLENGHIYFDGTPDELINNTDNRIKQFLEKVYY